MASARSLAEAISEASILPDNLVSPLHFRSHMDFWYSKFLVADLMTSYTPASCAASYIRVNA